MQSKLSNERKHCFVCCLLVCLLACLLFVVCLLACLFVCSFVRWFVCLFVRSFVRLFVWGGTNNMGNDMLPISGGLIFNKPLYWIPFLEPTRKAHGSCND